MVVTGYKQRQIDYQESSPDIGRVASQSVFPVFRSAIGPCVSSATTTVSDVSQLICRSDVAHPGHYLGSIKCRRNRTVFTDHHLVNLEESFERQKYLSTKERALLAARLGLSQIQVKTWFQNRRMKWKKQVRL